MVALPRVANTGARLTTLLALGAVSLVACDDGRTYYPIKYCLADALRGLWCSGSGTSESAALPASGIPQFRHSRT